MSLMRVVNALSKIKNALMAKHDFVDIESNSTVYSICDILKKQGYIKDYYRLDEYGNRNVVRVELKYIDVQKNRPVIKEIKLVTKPSRRVYVGASDIKPVRGGLGIGIISTSQGIMVFDEAKKRNLGGEVICEVF